MVVAGGCLLFIFCWFFQWGAAMNLLGCLLMSVVGALSVVALPHQFNVCADVFRHGTAFERLWRFYCVSLNLLGVAAVAELCVYALRLDVWLFQVGWSLNDAFWLFACISGLFWWSSVVGSDLFGEE